MRKNKVVSLKLRRVTGVNARKCKWEVFKWKAKKRKKMELEKN